MRKINLKGVKIDTWVRLIVLFIAFISQFLVLIGKRTETIDIDKWQEYATYFATAITAIWGFWKNNSFTKAAQLGDVAKDLAKENDEDPFSDLKIEESEVDLDVSD